MIHAIPTEVIIGMNYSKAGRCHSTEVICPGWHEKWVVEQGKKCFSVLSPLPLPSLKNYKEIYFPLLTPILSVRSGARCWLHRSGAAWCQCKASPPQLPDTFADKFQHSALIWKALKQNASQKGKAPKPGSTFGSSYEPKKGVWWHTPASWNSQQHEKCLDRIFLKEEFSSHWGLSALTEIMSGTSQWLRCSWGCVKGVFPAQQWPDQLLLKREVGKGLLTDVSSGEILQLDEKNLKLHLFWSLM